MNESNVTFYHIYLTKCTNKAIQKKNMKKEREKHDSRRTRKTKEEEKSRNSWAAYEFLGGKRKGSKSRSRKMSKMTFLEESSLSSFIICINNNMKM